MDLKVDMACDHEFFGSTAVIEFDLVTLERPDSFRGTRSMRTVDKRKVFAGDTTLKHYTSVEGTI